jgi:acyl-CoA dehydrogenase
MGFTQEHDLHFATKRLWGWRADYGSDAEWAALLGRAAIRAGEGFWAALTERRLIAAP